MDRSKIVQKPVSSAAVEDPREFQIQQLRRRYSPKEAVEEDGTAFTFKMTPSDPDFPFDMEALECVLHVPRNYPSDGRPSLGVKNKEMGRGYQINVERGFDALVAKSSQMALLGLMNALDKQLEALLTEQKAETVKIVPNAYSAPRSDKARVLKPPQVIAQDAAVKPTSTERPVQTYTPEQKRGAQVRRENETRQLEARLGRLPNFFKSSDGIAYTLPIEPRRRGELPVPLQLIKTVRLFVPLLYPLQSCRIEIQGVARDAASNTETGFEKKVRESPETTLMGHINYLSQNMYVLATEPVKEDVIKHTTVPDVGSLHIEQSTDDSKAAASEDVLDDRSHVKIIPRPPEWAVGGEEDAENDSDDSDSYNSDDDSMDEDAPDGLDTIAEVTSTGPEHGILLSFPHLELYGIELLEVVSLSITVRCDRCKDSMDINNLRPSGSGEASGVRIESCKKCANAFDIGIYELNSFYPRPADLLTSMT